ncbi:MAG: type II secretion system protein [Desulfobacterium sp.]|nr:type II secretion system protein [Desulfobacterium sp.]
MRNKCAFKNSSGFTLLEIIITLIVASILGSMLVSYSGTALQQSGKPALDTMDSQSMGVCLDCIVQSYRTSFDVDDLASDIRSGAFSTPCPDNMIGTLQQLRYDSSTNSFVSDVGGSFLGVNITGKSGLTYSMIF